MPSPSSSLASQRSDLAESFYEFDYSDQGYIGYQVLPIVSVQKQAGNFGKIPIEQLLKNRDTERAPGSGYARGDFTFEPATYSCVEHGAEEPVDDREREMFLDYFDSDEIATMRAMNDILRNAEKRVAALIFDNFSTNTTAVSNEWNAAAGANSDPIGDVEAAVDAIYNRTGLWADTLVISKQAFRKLRNVAQIVDRVASNGAGSSNLAGNITVAQLAEAFDLPKILVGNSTKNGANEGQTASPSQIWNPNYAWVGVTSSSRDFRKPCIGRTFHWEADGSQERGLVEQYRDETVRSDIFRVRHDVDEEIIYEGAGQRLTAINS